MAVDRKCENCQYIKEVSEKVVRKEKKKSAPLKVWGKGSNTAIGPEKCRSEEP